ncbi:MAG: hypothetical protein R3247_13985, partial [Rhodothermales bacterium]|nr:hypothetical protein [Rhodothermales bacterium]
MPFRLFSARFTAALLCAGLAAAVAVGPAQAQFTALWSAAEVQRGQRTNLFAHWEGQRALGAVVVELPPQWRLAGAAALRRGHGRIEMDVQRFREGSNAYLVRPPTLLDGAVEIVLQAEVAGSIGASHWAVVPVLRAERDGRGRFAVRQGLREERPVRLVEPVRARDNLVLAFQGSGAPWRLRRSALPDLGARAAFTVEFWMRTTDLDEVLLSAWDGREQVAYPLEIVVDAAGRLRYFRGQPGRHESMASTRPVAD